MFGKSPPKLDGKIKLVFDSGKLFAASSACAKLRTGTLTSDAELAVFAGCVQSALKQQALDKEPMPKASELTRTAGARYLKSWFAKSLHPQLVVPTGQQLIGTSINRRLPATEASGVAVMIYVLVDGSNRVTTVYAYAGHWAYPI